MEATSRNQESEGGPLMPNQELRERKRATER